MKRHIWKRRWHTLLHHSTPQLQRITFVRLCSLFSSRSRHTRFDCDWSSDVCSSDLLGRSRSLNPRWVALVDLVLESLEAVVKPVLGKRRFAREFAAWGFHVELHYCFVKRRLQLLLVFLEAWRTPVPDACLSSLGGVRRRDAPWRCWWGRCNSTTGSSSSPRNPCCD